MQKRIFGHISEYPEGSWFATRTDVRLAGVHRPRIAGICGGEREGAESILLSGGYEDDTDYGNLIYYTGEGGRDEKTNTQIANQSLSRGNLALVYSQQHRLPVRVIRSATHKSPYSPKEGFLYGGLYKVINHEYVEGISGYYIHRYTLQKI